MLIKNKFYTLIQDAENRGASTEELSKILGKARSKKGMFEGDLDEGELEIGQISAHIKDIKSAAQIVNDLWTEYLEAKKALCSN